MPQCASDACQRPQRWWSRSTAGAVLDGAWVCSRACVERLVRERLATGRPGPDHLPRLPPVRLGAMLRHHKACAPEVIEQALAAQTESRLRLGAQLRTMGVVEPHDLLRALAAQAGVGYLATVDMTAVQHAPGGLALDAIHALGVLPIGPPANGRIPVAFPAPVPRGALSAFRQQTGWTVDPYLVGDEDWLRLLEQYGAGEGGSPRVAMVRAASHDDAVWRVSDAVMSADRATVREAHWGPYVWIRVHGGEGVADVLLERSPEDEVREDARKEDPWPVANMSR